MEGKNVGSNENILTVLNCAIASVDDPHLCYNPITLSCGHHICKDCLQQEINDEKIICKTCNQKNNQNLNKKQKSETFDCLLEQHLSKLLGITYESFKEILEDRKVVKENKLQRIETHIEFIRSEILLKVESLKIELDKLFDSFTADLDEIKCKWISEEIDQFDAKIFQEDFEKLEQIISKQQNLTKESLYYYEQEVRDIKNILQYQRKISPTLEFLENGRSLRKSDIGDITFFMDIDEKLNKIKRNEYKKIAIDEGNIDMLILPDNNILVSNYNNKCLQVYDQHFNPLKTVKKINNKPFVIYGMTADEKNNIYMCDNDNNLVIKTDLDFNQSALFGNEYGKDQLKNPIGICYYNDSVYVCDCRAKRIQKLDSNLKFQASFPLDYEPWYIKNICNVAMVRASFYFEYVVFYNLETFTVLNKYDRHNGIIGASNSFFFEYYTGNQILYCYSSDGELRNEIYIDVDSFDMSINDEGAICMTRSKLYFALFNKEHIVAA